MPLGREAERFFTRTFCVLLLFLSEKGLQTAKDRENQDEVCKYKIKISLREWNKRLSNDQKPTFTFVPFHLDSPFAVINTVEGGAEASVLWDGYQYSRGF